MEELIRLSNKQGRNFIPFIFSKMPERIEYYPEYNGWIITGKMPITFLAPTDGKYSLAGSSDRLKQIGFQEPYSDQEPKPFYAKMMRLFTSAQSQIEFQAKPETFIKKGADVAKFQQISPFKDYSGKEYSANTVVLDNLDLLYTGGIFPKETKRNGLTKDNWATTASGKIAIVVEAGGK